MSNTYADPYAVLRAATGHDTSTLIANLTRIGSPGITAGATSIPLTSATTTALIAYDQLYIFDGAISEILTVAATTNQGATSLSTSAAQYAHTTGTVICTDGTGGLTGSLPAMLFTASTQIEEYCRQPLLQATYSNEKLPLRTMRAAVTCDYTLMLRPRRFPVQSISAASLVIAGQTTLALNTSQANIDSDAQLVHFLQMQTGNALFAARALPTTAGYVLLSYTAGYLYSALPPAIRQACVWMTSDLLSDRRNPTGAADLRLGDMQLTTRMRGDTTGRSVLVIRAIEALGPYRQRTM